MVRRLLHPKTRQRRAKLLLLDPFRPVIRHLVLEKDLSAVRVLEELRKLGYGGGYTILVKFIRTFRLRPARRAHLRFETDPGEQGQVDLSPYTLSLSDVATAVVCFSFILGFSRWQFICFFLHAEVHNVCFGHVQAFDEAGGVPNEILYDRMKQVVLESYQDGVLWHPMFERLAQHYGFRAVALEPGYKEGKGKVENPFKYVEGNFLAGRSFRDMEDLNAQAQRWLRETARVRIHRTTQERPVDRLDQERPKLIALPPKHFQAAQVEQRTIGADFCVAWDTNRYSVPPRFADRHDAWVHVVDGHIDIHLDGERIARHVLRDSGHKRYVLPEHEAEFFAGSRRRDVLQHQFSRLGGAAEAFAEGLRETRGGAAGYHMGLILQLADRVGNERVAKALHHALRYGAFDAKAVQRIVSAKSPAAAAPPAAITLPPGQIEQYLRGAGTHQRSPEDYLRTIDTKKKDPDDGQ